MKHRSKHIQGLSQAWPDRHTNLRSGMARPLQWSIRLSQAWPDYKQRWLRHGPTIYTVHVFACVYTCKHMHTHIHFISFSLFAQQKLHSANNHHAVPTPSTSSARLSLSIYRKNPGVAFKGYSSYDVHSEVITMLDHQVPKKRHSCPC
jgi:hypothetical protein